ncbi:flagellar basal body rod protein FlgB [Pradoshia sp. D12]|uniref:flagellar basal body rod protein FlgB n=1 Tax=Bacillaceae TaxID=186817 RepID=UPI00080AF8D1|nr:MULTISPECIES: flagellar basal body rod protein FlgB [Bacillaceae]OCA89630.1 flagellar basal body rod protein FlgB [Bacillus sp. FJAT-27986]QFK70973.1 flagellar basal body rod protein FlgB [Pradoshia sp. D12]TPF72765.1 flagellar basal body rod protein FlgB [Bacillus sp. D12]
MKLFSNTVSLLEQGLNYSSLKSKAISQNIANVDTPNYKAKNVSFKSELDQAAQINNQSFKTDSRHFEFKKTGSSAIQVTSNSRNYNSTGNSVDMDSEMSDLATNQIYYNALIERLNGNFQTLKSVIQGGK